MFILLLNMSNEELNNRFSALEDHIAELIIRYIDIHKNPLETPVDYSLDVHSFCILSHAAFEEFIEDITLYSVDRIEREFNGKPRKYSYATLCLLHFDDHAKSINDDNDWPEIFNDYLLHRISARKVELSKYAMQDNHGIDIKYLRKLLQPIGIEIPRNPNEISALAQLKAIRGAYAHSYARNQRLISPEDAEKLVYDVLSMVERIKNKAINMSYYLV